jgi:hypothetical protein
MKHLIRTVVAAFLCFAGSITQAADFDGTKALICAPVEAMDCVPGEGCLKGTADDIGAPAFMRIDFVKKVVIGPKRTSPILYMDKSADQVLLQGTELGYAWALVLDTQGKMTTTLADRNGVFVMFGSCTPL